MNISRNILSTTDLCLSCSKTVGTGLNRQKMVSMTSSELGSKTLKLNTASVRLNSFENEGHSIQKVLVSTKCADPNDTDGCPGFDKPFLEFEYSVL